MPWQKPLHELIHGLDVSPPEVSAHGLHGKDYFNAGCLSQFEASFVRWPVHCSSKISNLFLSPPWSNKGLLDVLMIKCAINFSRVTFVHVFCRKYPCPGACLILWHATINRAASKATAAGVRCQPSGQKILNKNHECEWLSEGKLEWLLIYRLLDNS